MHAFFHGWRRKTGMVTLVMAGPFVVGWVYGHSLAPNSEGGIGVNVEFKSPGIAIECTEFGYAPQSLESYTSHLRVLAELFVPYWAIAVPLTLLSAYLILWKPRKPSSRLRSDDPR